MIIITDSAADITKLEAQEMNIQIVPLRIQFSDGVFPMETEENFRKFFDKLAQEKDLPVTSQPSPDDFLKHFEQAKNDNEEVLVITLSSGLSGTFNSANLAKQLSEYENIHIVDSEQAILTQRMLVEKAVSMRKEDKDIEEIVTYLEELKGRLTVCGMLDTLTYLKKGGRIPAGVALIGNALHIKPLIELKDKTLVMLGKARGRNTAMKQLWAEFESYDIDWNEPVYFGYTSDKKLGTQFMGHTAEKYGIKNCRLFSIGGVIGTHVGPACMAISFTKKKNA